MTALAYDDEDDLDAREDLGYRGSREAEPDDLDVREEAPPAPAAARSGVLKPAAPDLAGARGKCRYCPADDVLLHQPPASTSRVACSDCVGKMYRDQVERGRTAIRDLKASAATGDHQTERHLIGELRMLFGSDQAEQTLAAIRQKLDAGAQSGGGRR